MDRRVARVIEFLLAATAPAFAAFGLQQWLWSMLQPFAYFLFWPAVFLSARYSFWSGIVATATSTILAWYYLPPSHSFHIPTGPHALTMLVFALMGFLFSLVHAQLRKANEQLEIAVRARDDFLAIAGHELRTPLATLLLHVQSLQRSTQNDPKRLEERLRKIGASGQRLQRLINQLLDVSRITAGSFRLEPEVFDLSQLVEEVVRLYDGISARCPDRLRVRLDRLRIEQVLTNLLGNAVKYGQGQPVEVELHGDEGDVVLRVVDHGIGIDPEQQKEIFERFARGVTSRDFGGFGLGLWITRQIVEASGGTIEVESALGKGSTFTVRLPRA